MDVADINARMHSALMLISLLSTLIQNHFLKDYITDKIDWKQCSSNPQVKGSDVAAELLKE